MKGGLRGVGRGVCGLGWRFECLWAERIGLTWTPKVDNIMAENPFENMAKKAMILHTSGVQVGWGFRVFWAQGSGFETLGLLGLRNYL